MPESKAELLSRIKDAWSQLEQTIAGLSEDQLTMPRDGQDWSIKDHLAHLTFWEQSLLALLRHCDRQQASAPDETTTATVDHAEMHAAAYEHNRQRPLDEVLRDFRESHQALVVALAVLSDVDLLMPGAHHPPADALLDDDAVISWIMRNTYEHYLEHDAWIRGLLKVR